MKRPRRFCPVCWRTAATALLLLASILTRCSVPRPIMFAHEPPRVPVAMEVADARFDR